VTTEARLVRGSGAGNTSHPDRCQLTTHSPGGKEEGRETRGADQCRGRNGTSHLEVERPKQMPKTMSRAPQGSENTN